MTISDIATLITELGVIFGVIVWVTSKLKFITEGVKCLLRSEMLQTYYRHKESGKIRQYELENFVFLHKAYKALNGNSFIDKIYDEVMEWEVLT